MVVMEAPDIAAQGMQGTTKLLSTVLLALLFFSLSPAASYAQDAPCASAKGDAELQDCLRAQTRKLGREYDSVFSRLRKQLPKGHRDQLLLAQTRWGEYVEAYCAAVAALYEGGAMEPNVRVACRLHQLQVRIGELKEGYKRVQGATGLGGTEDVQVQLDRFYSDLLRGLDERDRSRLEIAQGYWRDYVEAHCSALADFHRAKGRDPAIIASTCRREHLQRRLEGLEADYAQIRRG